MAFLDKVSYFLIFCLAVLALTILANPGSFSTFAFDAEVPHIVICIRGLCYRTGPSNDFEWITASKLTEGPNNLGYIGVLQRVVTSSFLLLTDLLVFGLRWVFSALPTVVLATVSLTASRVFSKIILDSITPEKKENTPVKSVKKKKAPEKEDDSWKNMYV